MILRGIVSQIIQNAKELHRQRFFCFFGEINNNNIYIYNLYFLSIRSFYTFYLYFWKLIKYITLRYISRHNFRIIWKKGEKGGKIDGKTTKTVRKFLARSECSVERANFQFSKRRGRAQCTERRDRGVAVRRCALDAPDLFARAPRTGAYAILVPYIPPNKSLAGSRP